MILRENTQLKIEFQVRVICHRILNTKQHISLHQMDVALKKKHKQNIK